MLSHLVEWDENRGGRKVENVTVACIVVNLENQLQQTKEKLNNGKEEQLIKIKKELEQNTKSLENLASEHNRCLKDFYNAADGKCEEKNLRIRA